MKGFANPPARARSSGSCPATRSSDAFSRPIVEGVARSALLGLEPWTDARLGLTRGDRYSVQPGEGGDLRARGSARWFPEACLTNDVEPFGKCRRCYSQGEGAWTMFS